jgi:hypothetical protein
LFFAAREELAAALNAWPEMIQGNSLFPGEPMLYLPLAERSDDK